MTVLLLKPNEITPELVKEWDRLFQIAHIKNVFYHPLLLLGAFQYFSDNQQIYITAVYNDEKELISIFPVIFEEKYKNIKIPTVKFWQYPHCCFLAAPLIHPDYNEQIFEEIIDFFKKYGKLFSFRQCYTQDKFIQLVGHKKSINHFNQFERAALITDLPFDTYWENALPKKKRKEIQRCYNRLTEKGVLKFDYIIQPNIVDIENFISLESIGYKGKQNISMQAKPEKYNFMMSLSNNPYDTLQVILYQLSLDNQPIASFIGFKSQEYFFAFKTAYNEDYAQLSPGVLLFREVTRCLLGEQSHIIADSCAIPNHPMINSLWRERLTISEPEFAISGYTAYTIINGTIMLKYFRKLLTGKK